MSFPDCVPAWVLLLLVPLCFSGGVLFWAQVLGDRYDAGYEEGMRDTVEDLMRRM